MRLITMSSRAICYLTSLMLAFALIPASYAAKDEIYTKRFGNTAVSGYDVVAYFTAGKPAKGNKKYSFEYKSADWHFSSQEHLDKFKANPEMYAPQYGGYCAWAVANGDTASSDPKQWNIHDGKLYLNYNAKIQKKWLKDKSGFIEKADQNWPSVLN